MQCLGSYCYELPKHLSAPKFVWVYLNFSTFDIFFLPIYINCFEPCIVKTLLVKTTFGKVLLYMLHHQHGGQNRNIKRFWKGRFKSFWTIWTNKHYVQEEINSGLSMGNTAAILFFIPLLPDCNLNASVQNHNFTCCLV